MDMSRAALPPIHGRIDPEDKLHPRFDEYRRYRAAMSTLLVRADGFKDWLGQIERNERDEQTAQHPQFAEFQRWMRETQAGARKSPAGAFPHNFRFWLKGGRW